MQRAAIPASLREAYDRTLDTLRRDRQRQRRGAETLRALLDTVPAGLLVLPDDGSIELVNRAAHRLLGESRGSSPNCPRWAPKRPPSCWRSPPACIASCTLANGRRVLASASQFSTPDGLPQRLISLQRLAGDLDAVSLTAWDDMARVLAHEMMNSLTPIASLSQSLDGLLRNGGPREEVAGGAGGHHASQPGPAAFRRALPGGRDPARAYSLRELPLRCCCRAWSGWYALRSNNVASRWRSASHRRNSWHGWIRSCSSRR